MAYQSLYRRYRPQRFSEIRGQDHVVGAVHNAVREGRVGHAYLFSGPRGTGKTTIARVLAKALNCENLSDGEPCGECESCVAIEAGASFDLQELDAASNNKVDEMRELIARAALGTPGRNKVYILDEVHMLTAGASNALLKTLEEPPEHVTFVLATTDPQKVLPTIRSRTQHFELGLLPATEIEAMVTDVVADADLDVGDDGIAEAVRRGRGSARDALSALDQIAAAGGVRVDGSPVDEMLAAICARDAAAALTAVAEALAAGRDPRVLGEATLNHLRDAFMARMGGPSGQLTEADAATANDVGNQLGPAGLTRSLELLGEALLEMRQAPDPRIPLEVALLRLTRPESDPAPAALLDRIERLEARLDGGATPASPAPTPDAGPTATEDPDDPAPPRPQRGRESSAAAKARSKSSSASILPEKPAASPPEPASSEPPAPSPEPGDASPVAPVDEAPPASEPAAAAGGAELPTRDELTLGWGDVVLHGLRPAVKARFAAGRFVRVDEGTAVFALPNEVHRDKCRERQADVEQALADHFGRPVPLELVVDDDADRPPPPGSASDRTGGEAVVAAHPEPSESTASAGSDGQDDDETVIDLTELENAPASAASSGVDKLTSAFPGAELVEEEEA